MQHPRTALPLAAGALAVALLSPLQVAAQQPLSSETQTHTVLRGDTLWDLSRRYLGDPFLWPQIYKQNTSVVEDPHWIYPGEVLTIAGGTAPAVPGTDTPTSDVADAGAQDDESPQPGVLGNLGNDAGDVSDEVGSGAFPRIGSRVAKTESWRIDPQTYRALRPSEFYSSGFLTEEQNLKVGQMFGPSSPLDIGRGGNNARATAMLYANVSVAAPAGEKYEVGDSVLSFYYGKEIEGYGKVVHPTGLVRVTRTESGKVFGSVVALYGPVRAGQMVMRAEKFSDGGRQRAVPVADGVDAKVIGWPGYMELKNPIDVVFLDKGQRDGVRPGDVFELRRTPANDGEMADLMATLTIVRVGERTATARVAKVTAPRIAVGVVAKQVARLPS